MRFCELRVEIECLLAIEESLLVLALLDISDSTISEHSLILVQLDGLSIQGDSFIDLSSLQSRVTFQFLGFCCLYWVNLDLFILHLVVLLTGC